MRLKITDGDLLLIQVNANTSEKSKTVLGDIVDKWLRGKGLDNVSACIVPVEDAGLSFEVLSVNDVFEDNVLRSK